MSLTSPKGTIRVTEMGSRGREGKFRTHIQLPTADYSKVRVRMTHPAGQIQVTKLEHRLGTLTETEDMMASVGIAGTGVSSGASFSHTQTKPLIKTQTQDVSMVVDGKSVPAQQHVLDIDHGTALRFVGKENPVFLIDTTYAFVPNEPLSSSIKLEIESELRRYPWSKPQRTEVEALEYGVVFEGQQEELARYVRETGISYRRIDKETTVNDGGTGKTYFHASIVAGGKPIASRSFSFFSKIAKFPSLSMMRSIHEFQYGGGDDRRTTFHTVVDLPQEKHFRMEFDPPLLNETFDVWFEYVAKQLFCRNQPEAIQIIGEPYEEISLEIVAETSELCMRVFFDGTLAAKSNDVYGAVGSKLGYTERLPLTSVQPQARSLIDLSRNPGRSTGFELRVTQPARGTKYAIRWSVPP